MTEPYEPPYGYYGDFSEDGIRRGKWEHAKLLRAHAFVDAMNAQALMKKDSTMTDSEAKEQRLRRFAAYARLKTAEAAMEKLLRQDADPARQVIIREGLETVRQIILELVTADRVEHL